MINWQGVHNMTDLTDMNSTFGILAHILSNQMNLYQGWIKSQKIQNCLAWISRNFKTVWQGESGELKTVCWFFKYCLLNFLNCFCVANCLIWLKVKKIEAYSSTFCSINALSINKDNPLLPLQSTTPVFVCQMRKSLKLSVRGEF